MVTFSPKKSGAKRKKRPKRKKWSHPLIVTLNQWSKASPAIELHNEKVVKNFSLGQRWLKEAQKLIRKRLWEVRTRSIDHRNRLLINNESKNPSVYWDLLKKTVG